MQKFKRGLALGEDTVFMYDLVQKSVRMEFTNARWYLYRTHGQSATHRQKEYREEKLLAFYKTRQKAAAQAGNTEYAQKMEWARLSALRKKYNVARWRGQADVCLRVRREVLCIMRRRKTDLSKLVYYLTFHSMILYGIGSTMSHLVRRMKGEKI